MRLNQLNEALERVFLNEYWTENEKIDKGFEFYDEANGSICRVTGHNGSGIIYVDEFEIDENGDMYKVGERMLTLNEIKRITGNKRMFLSDFYESYSLTEEYEDGAVFQAYITNLGKYNEGYLVGEWCAFPIDEDDFEELLERIGINEQYEEWFVTDYECALNGFNWQDLGEYPSYDDLQEFGEALENVDDFEKFSNVYEAFGDFDSAINSYDDAWFIPNVRSESDLAEEYIDIVYGRVEMMSPETIERYFDYEQLGRELDFDNYADMYDEEELAQMYENGDIEYDDQVSAGEYLGLGSNASNYDIGEEYVSQVGFGGISNPEYYFDYEAFGRDLSFDGDFTSDGFVFTY